MENLGDIYDELIVRFLLFAKEEELCYRERLYFILEEAHWYFLDFMVKKYNVNTITFKIFCKELLERHKMPYDLNDLIYWGQYKFSVPVYGAIILNNNFKRVLLVSSFTSGVFNFPKGKKNYNELPIDCVIREVYEETNLDIKGYVSSMFVETERGRLYFVFNLHSNYNLKPNTRKEIKEIKWFTFNEIKTNPKCSFLVKYIPEILTKIQKYKDYMSPIDFGLLFNDI